MDLRKNLPAQNDSSPSSSGASSAFDKLGNAVFGCFAVVAGIFFLVGSLFSGSSSNKSQTPVETKQVAETKTPTAQPQKNLADANVQQNNQPQQKPVEQKPVEQKPVEQKPVEQKAQTTQTQSKPVEQKVQTTQPQQKPKPTPPTSLPQVNEKPAASNVQTTQPQQRPKPTPPTSLPQQKPAVANTPKPVSPPPVSKPAVAVASAGKSSSWLKTAGKIGIGILTKGKVKIR